MSDCCLTHYCSYILSLLYITGATSGAGTAYHSAVPEFTPGFQWGSCYWIFSFICTFCRSLFIPLSFFSWLLCCLSFFSWLLCCLSFFSWLLCCLSFFSWLLCCLSFFSWLLCCLSFFSWLLCCLSFFSWLLCCLSFFD